MIRACVSCGEDNLGCLEHHHITPDVTMPLCPNCHALTHRGLLIVDNEISRRAKALWAAMPGYAGPMQLLAILYILGYEPRFDGETEERGR